jgi:hypothetical protein
MCDLLTVCFVCSVHLRCVLPVLLSCCPAVLQQRADAEAARKGLDGLVLHGMEMRVGWGKAVPLPPVPLYSGTGVPTGPLTGACVLLCSCPAVSLGVIGVHAAYERGLLLTGHSGKAPHLACSTR